jgi:D-tagatose-1,6-bisphosphate aldolase subunit GatZ/KbaZ
MNGALEKIAEANRANGTQGIYSVCSAHRQVIEAAVLQAKSDQSLLLIEATCNQVNQEGGYTGMTPNDFREYVQGIAAEFNFPTNQLILGGDHLGPNPWRSKPAAQAMAAARTMVAGYVRAGFTKVHLDASMACSDDPQALGDNAVAARAADLCQAAESVADPANAPYYIIGTEVPVPGGAHEDLQELAITRVEDLAKTIEIQRAVFESRGLHGAWDRVIGVVVQPGVEFDHARVIDYQCEKAKTLSEAILRFERLVYEAHSTDYQTETALTNLVRDHFAILKVGPGLTYAAREALFALSHIEQEWITDRPRSDVRAKLDEVMMDQPKYWEPYYGGTEAERALARKYSFSDRLRYYWPDPTVEASFQFLVKNLSEAPPPLSLLSQFAPSAFRAIRNGELRNDPLSIIRHRIQEVLGMYARACGMSRSGGIVKEG